MNAGRTILVPLDGSPESEAVLPLAAQAAREERAQLVLFQAAGSRADLGDCCRHLEEVQASAAFLRLPVDVIAAVGQPEEEIPRLAKVRGADLIAMTTHGRTGLRRTLLGSVAGEVVRRSTIPVLLFRAGQSLHPLARIVVALEDSGESRQILPAAAELAKLHRAALHVLGVGRRGGDLLPHLRAACRELGRKDVVVQPVVRNGSAAREIVRYAKEIEAGFIMLATHARTGLSRALRGSVAESVLAASTVPVLVRRMSKT